MRRALGPFLTTGVALVAATVVVANPVVPPSRDMQISTTQLSTSPDLLSPSDKSLLSALAPQFPPAGIGPALAQILAALAADADRISRAVDSGVPTPAPLAAALPEQTVYRTDPMAPAAVVESANAAPTALGSTFVSSVVSSDVVQALNGLVADSSYLGGKVFEAAYAVVDVIIRVPQFVITAALDLLAGDIAGALDTVKSAIKAFFGPGLIILDGIRDILYGRQPAPVPPPTAIKSLTAAATPAAEETSSAGTDETATDTPAAPTRDGKGGSARKRDTTIAAARIPRPTSAPVSEPASAAASSAASAPTTSSNSTGSPATSKARATDKPAAGSGRSTAGSARTAKSATS